jgi:hypothetical protein
MTREKLGKMPKEAVVAEYRQHGICLEGLRRVTNLFNKDKKCPVPAESQNTSKTCIQSVNARPTCKKVM